MSKPSPDHHPFLGLSSSSKVLQGIQNGPYKNIYNPENFFVGSQGSGAANNWAAGYAAGDTVQEEVFDMIDREVDGSDSLEVYCSGWITSAHQKTHMVTGFHAPALNSRRYWFGTRQLSVGAHERPISEEAYPNILGVSRHPRRGRCSRQPL